ncbi:hypothetical protein HFD88_008290 [Aspergillus terreus]|nr:hypothetical protein HFD88_008290 [Aspergillus terreus]
MSFYRLGRGVPTLPLVKAYLPRGVASPRHVGKRSLATANSKQKEFLCILPDKPDALNLRKQVRPAHLEDIKPLVASGRVVAGGAMVERHPEEGEGVPFKGSMMIYTGDSIEDVRETLMKDIYAKSGVWDLEKAQIIPFISAIREQLSKR